MKEIRLSDYTTLKDIVNVENVREISAIPTKIKMDPDKGINGEITLLRIMHLINAIDNEHSEANLEEIKITRDDLEWGSERALSLLISAPKDILENIFNEKICPASDATQPLVKNETILYLYGNTKCYHCNISIIVMGKDCETICIKVKKALLYMHVERSVLSTYYVRINMYEI